MGIDIFLAIVGVILGIAGVAQSNEIEKNSLNRNTIATEVAAIWDEIIKKYNITSSELNQLLDSLGLKRETLMDAFRYSARLSKAREIAAKFLSEYPDKVAQVKNESRIIEERIADATKKRDQQVGEAQSGTRNDAVGSTWEASKHYSETQSKLDGRNETNGESPKGTIFNDAINKHYEGEQ